MNAGNQGWWDEYRELSDCLQGYGNQIAPKRRAGANQQSSRTEPERLFWDLWFFWNAALVNSGDLFSWLGYIRDHKDDLAAIGAAGTLEAIDRLMPFYLEQQQAKDASGQ